MITFHLDGKPVDNGDYNGFYWFKTSEDNIYGLYWCKKYTIKLKELTLLNNNLNVIVFSITKNYERLTYQLINGFHGWIRLRLYRLEDGPTPFLQETSFKKTRVRVSGPKPRHKTWQCDTRCRLKLSKFLKFRKDRERKLVATRNLFVSVCFWRWWRHP